LSLDLTQVNNCQLPYTYTHAVKKNGVVIAQPAWLVWNAATRTYSYDITAPADVGSYEVTITATTSQLAHSETFTLTVKSDCENTTITDRTFNNMQTLVSGAADTQNIFFDNSIATSHGNSNYCGGLTYTMSPSYSFLTISGNTLTLSTTNPNDTGGPYTVTLTIALQNFPSITL
jgi:membrane-bound inhibitor of C-type lysozyme